MTCLACKNTGCKNGWDHSGCGAGVIGPLPEPCPFCNEGDKTGQVKQQILLSDEWNRGLSSMYFRSTC